MSEPNLNMAFAERRRKLGALKAMRSPAVRRGASTEGMVCPGCRQAVDLGTLEQALFVCGNCGHHHRLSHRRRFQLVLDPGTGRELFSDIGPRNPLDFPGYDEKLEELRGKTGMEDACVCMEGDVGGHRVVCAVLDSSFLMGSMGTAVGEKVTRAVEYAQAQGLPLLIFSASGGARMQEGIFSLMQMAKTSAAIRRFSDAGGLFISYLTHPTTGGVTASFASLGDIVLAEPGALIGFAGPRVIQQTIRAKLPQGFQRAEFQLAHGFVDAVVPRAAMRSTLIRILDLHRPAAAKGEVRLPPTQAVPAPRRSSLTPQQRVQLARDPRRPNVGEYLDALVTDFFETHGDRLYGDDAAILCGVARLGPAWGPLAGLPVTVAGYRKGRTLPENLACNFGMPQPEGYRKFQRAAAQAEKFSRPVLTFIDTPGAYPGIEAEERGQGEAIAGCLRLLSGLGVPVLAVITGEGGSGGALALGLADRVLMLENAVYSVLSPEGFASILWKDASRSKEACGVMKLTAQDLLAFGVADGVIPEPKGGAGKNPQAVFSALQPVLRQELAALLALDREELLRRRYAKYRAMGQPPN